MLEGIVLRPYDQSIEQYTEMLPFLFDLGNEPLALLGGEGEKTWISLQAWELGWTHENCLLARLLQLVRYTKHLHEPSS